MPFRFFTCKLQIQLQAPWIFVLPHAETLHLENTSVSPWLFAGTSASVSLATSAVARLETARIPARDAARMRSPSLFHIVCVFEFFLFGVCQFVGFLCLLHLFLCVFFIVVLLRLSVCCVCCIHLFVAQICRAWIIPQEIPFDILYFYREPVWRTNMELLTANVLEVSLERTVNQSRSLPTLLEVRVSLLIHRNLSPM